MRLLKYNPSDSSFMRDGVVYSPAYGVGCLRAILFKSWFRPNTSIKIEYSYKGAWNEWYHYGLLKTRKDIYKIEAEKTVFGKMPYGKNYFFSGRLDFHYQVGRGKASVNTFDELKACHSEYKAIPYIDRGELPQHYVAQVANYLLTGFDSGQLVLRHLDQKTGPGEEPKILAERTYRVSLHNQDILIDGAPYAFGLDELYDHQKAVYDTLMSQQIPRDRPFNPEQTCRGCVYAPICDRLESGDEVTPLSVTKYFLTKDKP